MIAAPPVHPSSAAADALYPALEALEIGGALDLPEASVLRLDIADYKIVFPSGKVRRWSAGGALGFGPAVERTIFNVIECIQLQGAGQNMSTFPLSDKQMTALLDIAAADGLALADDFHGSTVNALVERGLVERGGVEERRLSLTLAGDAAVEQCRPHTDTAPVEAQPLGADANGTPPLSELLESEIQTDALVLRIGVVDTLLYDLYPPLRALVEALSAAGLEVVPAGELVISLLDSRQFPDTDFGEE